MYIFIFIFLLSLSVQTDAFAVSNPVFSDDTPASLFGNGVECYYFSPEGIHQLKYENIKDNQTDNDEPNNIIQNDFKVHLTEEGKAVMIKKDKDYTCPEDKESNCAFSDPIIEKIDVINLTGKSDAPAIKKHIKEKSPINFGIGSKMYSLETEIPEYNFLSFQDFNKLKCIEDENGSCEIFPVNHEEYHVAALLGFQKYKKNLFIKNGENNISLIFNEETNDIFETTSSCLQEAEPISDNLTVHEEHTASVETDKTSQETEEADCNMSKTAHVEEATRPDGLSYFMLQYDNIDKKKEVYFIDPKGRGFKIYLGKKYNLTMHMLNKTAAETVRKAL